MNVLRNWFMHLKPAGKTIATVSSMEFPTITCKNSNVSWMPVRDSSSAHLNTVILRRSLNNFTDCLCIEIKILLITFKVLQGSAPKYLIDLISVLPPSRYDLRRNNKGILLSTPKRFTKVTIGDRSFMAAALRLWNSLPVSIRSACTKNDFKQKLKTFLFSKSFC